MYLHSCNTRDFQLSKKRLKKLANAVGIPPEIDARAAQGAVDSDLSGLSQECRDSLVDGQSAVTPEPEQLISEGMEGSSESDTDEQSQGTDDDGGM